MASGTVLRTPISPKKNAGSRSMESSALPRTAARFAIDESTLRAITDRQGKFFNQLASIPPEKIAADLVNPVKARRQAVIIERFASLANKRILEIGSGFGMNLIIWAQEYGADVYGVEPDSEGFDSSAALSRSLLTQNGLDPSRIVSAPGEKIPFEDGRFDIVFSANVLEHTGNPGQVLDEALRIVKPGGTVQLVYPNYHSFFDGHYAVFHPPIFGNAFFCWYVKFIWRKDPGFAKTLRTELNVAWTRKTIARLKKKYDFDVVSLGEEIFRERMASIDFEAWVGLTKVKKLVTTARAARLNRIAAAAMIWFRAWAPIILTVQKK
jgi:SAM-dependent methyltransferase